jgi:uncharacterized pyridoxamine 5'-phosphate oxidase family protein
MTLWHLFNATQTVSVASVDESKPRLRLMTLICMNERLFLATGSGDNKTRQWALNPNLECLLPLSGDAGNGYLRIGGEARVVRDLALKQEVAETAKFIYNYWQDSANPDFILYEVLPREWRYLQPGADLEEVLV